MEKKKAKASKIAVTLICLMLVFVILFSAVRLTASAFGVVGVLELADNYLAGLFTTKTSDEVAEFKAKTGGIIKGVCHPDSSLTKENSEETNIGWVRVDTDCSFNLVDENGEPCQELSYTMDKLNEYKSSGLKIMIVYCPYLRSAYFDYGYDIRTTEGEKEIRRNVLVFFDIVKDYVDAIQVCNECGNERFSAPFTIEECAKFIGVIMETLNDVKGNVVVGYNTTPLSGTSLSVAMKPWLKYCDFVGFDTYPGCFDALSKSVSVISMNALALWNLTKKPIIVCEFGYIGYGAAKTDEEKDALMQEYGFESIEDAKANIWDLIEKLPASFQEQITSGVIQYSSDEDLANKLFSGENGRHLLRSLPDSFFVIGCEHTPEGQAKFIRKAINDMKKYDFICGAFVYCMRDPAYCYYCGFEDCPIETGWGLLDGNGNPKPAYYAVKEGYSDWN